MVLDYIQGLAQVSAMEMSDTETASLCAHGYWIHVMIVNKHLPDLQEKVFFGQTPPERS